MVASLKALLNGLIDYAGLFPPASLALDAAVGHYARHRGEPESWMLGRFICPAGRLPALVPYLEHWPPGEVLPLSVLCRGSMQQSTSAITLNQDICAAEAFQAQYAGRVAIEAFEIKLPTGLGRIDEVRQVLAAAAVVLEGHGFGGVPTFWEAVSIDDWRDVQPGVVAGIASTNETRGTDESARFGFKIRCGGVEAPAFPSVEQLAGGIAVAVQNHVPLKFTAGLHHPLRHFNAGVNCRMHGFLNVFAGAILTGACGLSESVLRDILESERIGDFTFAEGGLKWRDHHAGLQDIAAARQNVATSYGSCSFDEPREDLQGLGLLQVDGPD